MKEFLIAAQFLTRIPITIKGDVSEGEMGRSAIFFPLVGVLQGLVAAGAALLFSLAFSPDIAAGIVVVVLLLTNGGFHIDGLADTADGVSVRATGDPARDREKRLTIMKESTVGAIGVLAIASVLLLKYLFVSGVLGRGLTWDVFYILFLVPVFSKWAMVPVICHGKAARDEGLGWIFISHVGPGILLLSSAVLAAVFFLTGFFVPGRVWLDMLKLFLLLAFPLYALGLVWVIFCKREFGGLTGDTMGAVSEIAEIVVLAISFLWI